VCAQKLYKVVHVVCMTKLGVWTVYKNDRVLGNKTGNDDGWAWRSHASRFPSALSHIHRGRLRFYKIVESTSYDGRTRLGCQSCR
jgi:hypothetical protein